MSELTLPMVPDLWPRDATPDETWLDEVRRLAPMLDEAQRAASLQIMRCFATSPLPRTCHPDPCALRYAL